MTAIKLRCLGLCGNSAKKELPAALHRIFAICDANGIGYHLQKPLAELMDRPELGLDDADLPDRTDLIMALGGDGTMLAAARIIGDKGVPLLGINLGSLGYLTDVPLEDLEKALQRVLGGEYVLEDRARVHCRAWRDGVCFAEALGLNDVVVNMGPLPRMLDIELRLDGTSLGRYLGDGVIFATATGSTAYSLSAGGPICQPGMRGMLVTPICPHSLGVRPLIMNADTDIELVLQGVGGEATLTADGQVPTTLQAGDRLTCRLTWPSVHLVKFHDSDFFQVLRHKLRWGVAPRLRPDSPRYHAGCEGDADDPGAD